MNLLLTRKSLPPNANSVKHNAIVALLLLSIISIAANFSYAQSSPDYRKLIFEPVLLKQGHSSQQFAHSGTLSTGLQGLQTLQPEETSLQVSNTLNLYQQSIAELELNEGPFSHELSEQLVSLATLHHDSGNFASAIEVLEQAQHITRVNKGLFTLDQTPIVEGIITNYRAQNDFKQIDKHQGYLYYLHQRNYNNNDPEMLTATLNWAQWNIEAFLKNSAFLKPSSQSFNRINHSLPTSELVAVRNPSTGSYYFVERDQLFGLNSIGLGSRGFSEFEARSSAVSMRTIIDPHLRQARDLFESMLYPEDVNESNTVSTLAKQNLQYQLANVNFQIMRQIDFMIDGNLSFNASNLRTSQRRTSIPEVNRGYTKSKDALELIVTSLQDRDKADPEDVATAQINLADWHLSFERPQNAFKLYHEAGSTLKAAGLPDNEINSFFSSTTPITAPAFASHQYSRQLWHINADDRLAYKGYIDLAFNYNRGRMRRVTITNSSADTPQQIRKLLLQKVRTEKIRPFFTNGQVVEQADMALRYYYTY